MTRMLTVAIVLSLSPALALKTNTMAMPSHLLPEASTQMTSFNADITEHKLPQVVKSSLRATSWTAKIPDIEVNLALAQEWMTATTTFNENTSDATPLSGDGLNGTLIMASTPVKDAPLYYDCGLVMNTAWGAMARDPCGMSTWTASDKMKDSVPQCSALREGKRYTESYRALKMDQDTWCGDPICSPACSEGVKCFRNYEFPFEPICEGNQTVIEVASPQVPADVAPLAMYLAGVAVVLCLGLALLGAKQANEPALKPKAPA